MLRDQLEQTVMLVNAELQRSVQAEQLAWNDTDEGERLRQQRRQSGPYATAKGIYENQLVQVMALAASLGETHTEYYLEENDAIDRHVIRELTEILRLEGIRCRIWMEISHIGGDDGSAPMHWYNCDLDWS